MTPFLEVEPGNKYVRGSSNIKPSIGMVAVGIYAEDDSLVFLRLENQHKEKKHRFSPLRLILIFFGMVIITGLYFVYVVLPNEMKNRKED